MREAIHILTQTVLIVGQVIAMEGDMLVTRNGESRDTYNRQWFRPLTFDPLDVRRHAPDKRDTCHHLTQLALMTKMEKARMAYEKQYTAMAPRYLARKKAALTNGEDGVRRLSTLPPAQE